MRAGMAEVSLVGDRLWLSGSVATVSAATAAAFARRTFAGFVDRQRTAAEVIAIEGLNGRFHVLLGFHLHEAEAARAARLPIFDHLRGAHCAMSGKELLQILGRHRPSQITNIHLLRHQNGPYTRETETTSISKQDRKKVRLMGHSSASEQIWL
jgi:hypothetical protein